jgi:hypothetical protein
VLGIRREVENCNPDYYTSDLAIRRKERSLCRRHGVMLLFILKDGEDFTHLRVCGKSQWRLMMCVKELLA